MKQLFYFAMALAWVSCSFAQQTQPHPAAEEAIFQWEGFMPPDFPKYIDTGNSVKDMELYDIKRNEWIEKNSADYTAIKNKIALELSNGEQTPHSVILNTPVNTQVNNLKNIEKWVLKEIKIISSSSPQTSYNDIIHQFKAQYFQEGNILNLQDNFYFELSQQTELIAGKIETTEKGFLLKVKKDSCSDCYTDFVIMETLRKTNSWVWKFPSEFEGDDTIFELTFSLQ